MVDKDTDSGYQLWGRVDVTGAYKHMSTFTASELSASQLNDALNHWLRRVSSPAAIHHHWSRLSSDDSKQIIWLAAGEKPQTITLHSRRHIKCCHAVIN